MMNKQKAILFLAFLLLMDFALPYSAGHLSGRRGPRTRRCPAARTAWWSHKQNQTGGNDEQKSKNERRDVYVEMEVIPPTGAATFFRFWFASRNFDGVDEVWVFNLGHEWTSLGIVVEESRCGCFHDLRPCLIMISTVNLSIVTEKPDGLEVLRKPTFAVNDLGYPDRYIQQIRNHWRHRIWSSFPTGNEMLQ